MYLRMKSGAKAGQVVDVQITAARAMLADGRAELPDAVAKPVFATGGTVSPSEPVFVGLSVTGSFVPAAVAKQHEAVLTTINKQAAKAKPVSRRSRRK